MSDQDILNIFYNEIIPEAQKGRIDCFIYSNIIFEVLINNKYLSKVDKDNIEYQGILVPTLKISDKQLFNDLLIMYAKRALEFYDENDFIEEIRDNNKLKIKYIISILFGNASTNDFENPINFLQNRINMFDNTILNEPSINVGYIDKLNASLIIKEEKSKIYNETPYVLNGYLEFGDSYKLYLPNLYIANNEDNYVIYAMQKDKNLIGEEDSKYQKEIRKHIPAKIKGSPESYFIAAMISLGLCSDKEILINPLLISRWNAKRISMYHQNKIDKEILISKQENIQKNLTEGLIRIYNKIIGYSENINITTTPFEIDDKLHIEINDKLNCSIELFDNIYNLALEANKNEIHKHI